MLREWHENFPPTEADIERNQQVADYQGSRNLFVDFPELADRISDF
ncbi:MAG: endonuclease [Myxococcales bacterium]|nr:endonuclease [Myxococcales bacterium]